jgi:hypothetical protein
MQTVKPVRTASDSVESGPASDPVSNRIRPCITASDRAQNIAQLSPIADNYQLQYAEL